MQEKYNSIAEYNTKNFNKRKVFVLAKKNEKSSMEDHLKRPISYPANFIFKAEEEIYCPVKLIPRTIRYIKGETSIYKDEQDEKNPNGNKRVEIIQFIQGEKVIDSRDKYLLEYMEKSNYNGSNPNRRNTASILFTELNIDRIAKENIDKEKALIEAKNWCLSSKTPSSDIIAYAKAMNLFNAENDVDYHRFVLGQYASSDPVRFLTGTKDDVVFRKAKLIDAFGAGILTHDIKTSSVHWTDGGKIVGIPPGKLPSDYLTDYTRETLEGKMVYEIVTQRLNEMNEVPMSITKEELSEKERKLSVLAEIKKTNPDSERREMVLGMIQSAKEKGIMKQNKVNIEYKGEILHYNTLIKKLMDDSNSYRELEQLVTIQ